MKKTLVFVLGLGLLGAMAFAQDAPSLAFGAYVNEGIGIASDGTNTYITAVGRDSGTLGGRVQFIGKYSADNWGVYFRMRTTDPTNSAAVTINRMYGWVSGANGMIKAKAGVLDSYEWSTNGWQSFGNQDGLQGVQLELLPVEGLNLGVFMPTSSTPVATDAANPTVNSFSALVIGGEYTMANMGYLGLGYDLGNKYFWVGASYTGMAALTAVVEAKINNTDTPAANYFYVDEQIGYTMGQLGLLLYAEQQFNNSASALESTIMQFQPQVSYTQDVYTVGAFFRYLTDTKKSSMAPGVYAQVAVAKQASLQAGFQLDLGDYEPSNGASGYRSPINGSLGGPYTAAFTPISQTAWLGWLDFLWSF